MVVSGDGGDELFCGYTGYYDSIINLLPIYNMKKDFSRGANWWSTQEYH